MDLSKNAIYVGTTRGVLLCIKHGDKPSDLKIYKNDESAEVTAIAEGRNPKELVLGYENGNVQLFDTGKFSFTKKIDDLEGDEGVIGICCIKNSILIAKKDGVINIWTKKKNDFFSLNLDEMGSLDAMMPNKCRDNIVGTGGEKNDFKLWDVETKQCVFKAKSLGHDHLQLPIPTSIRGISFFNNESSLGACCTKEGHVLLYDERAQRKPVVRFLDEKASYTSITSAFRDTQVFVGTTKGYMQWLDLKQPPKILKTYTSFTGCVTDIACDPVEPYVTSVSLDRHLRVHRIDSKELITKLYMKQNLTKLLVKPVIKDEEEPSGSNAETVDQEYEDMFNNMEEIYDVRKSKKEKRKSKGDVKNVKKKKTAGS